MPLLSSSAPTAIKSDLLTLKSVLVAIVRGLSDDSHTVVDGVLSALYKGILADNRLPLELKMNAADTIWEPVSDLLH